MKIEKQSVSEATVTFSAEELRILNNSMNEALEALARDPDEFSTRMGVSVESVILLLKSVNGLIHQCFRIV